MVYELISRSISYNNIDMGEGGPFTSEYRDSDQSSNNFWPRLSECRDIDAMLGIAPLTSKIRMIP